MSFLVRGLCPLGQVRWFRVSRLSVLAPSCSTWVHTNLGTNCLITLIGHQFKLTWSALDRIQGCPKRPAGCARVSLGLHWVPRRRFSHSRTHRALLEIREGREPPNGRRKSSRRTYMENGPSCRGRKPPQWPMLSLPVCTFVKLGTSGPWSQTHKPC